jgi:site-specific DNA recombinase
MDGAFSLESVLAGKNGVYRRDHLRVLAQRVEVDAKEVRIMGSKSVLLRALVAASSAKTAGFGVPSFVPKWRARRVRT